MNEQVSFALFVLYVYLTTFEPLVVMQRTRQKSREIHSRDQVNQESQLCYISIL